MGATAALETRASRLLAALPATAVLVSMLSAIWIISDVPNQLDAGGLSRSHDHVTSRAAAVREELRRLPPDTWQGIEATGTLKAARYISECTHTDDYLLVAGYAPEVSVLSRRPFAAGQSKLAFSFYKSDADQRRALERLKTQTVPIVLAYYEDFGEAFVTDYPLLWDHVSAHYRRAGIIDVDDEPRFIVFADTRRSPSGTDDILGLPCFQ